MITPFRMAERIKHIPSSPGWPCDQKGGHFSISPVKAKAIIWFLLGLSIHLTSLFPWVPFCCFTLYFRCPYNDVLMCQCHFPWERCLAGHIRNAHNLAIMQNGLCVLLDEMCSVREWEHACLHFLHMFPRASICACLKFLTQEQGTANVHLCLYLTNKNAEIE